VNVNPMARECRMPSPNWEDRIISIHRYGGINLKKVVLVSVYVNNLRPNDQ
jgi:hypothetical protein